MIELIASVSVAAAASSCSCDEGAHFESFSKNVEQDIGVDEKHLAARQGENFFRAHAYRGTATQLGEFAHSRLCIALCGLERYFSGGEPFKGDRLAGLESKVVALA